jgi:propionyl-CoA carboxylase alpha chain
MIQKILIANRGEIAVRIIKTAHKMGIKAVAIYSDADRNSLAVKLADESYHVGPSPANMSYLNIDKLIDVVQKSGADAVHPGYGFLSENREFSKRLEEISVKFIGPGSYAIESMGDKIISKKIAKEAGVSTVPGYLGEVCDVAEAESISAEIGFPVMIKAAAGGGGRGMRIVYKESEISQACSSAITEAENNFGDGRIFIEKFIEKPRHIEIQVLGDKFGNILCLGERECSIQRYNQKIIEESPSSFITPEVRSEMYRQSKMLAAKVGYYSAGTIEYIVDNKGAFYFLEMNTRLQVEHPVTELVTGLDLVEQMINVANDKKLDLKQSDINLNGWAMESRIYAEDPTRGFLPSSGRIKSYKEPFKSENVRVDTGVYEGSDVSMFYDPMIAKLCSYGKNRKSAIENMRSALAEFVIDGVSNNIGLLEDIYKNDRFVKGDISTNYISEEYPEGFKMQDVESAEHCNIIYAAVIIKWLEAKRFAHISDKMDGREREVNTRWAVCIKEKIALVELLQLSDNLYKLSLQGKSVEVLTSWSVGNPLFRAVIDGVTVAIRFKPIPHKEKYRFFYSGRQLDVMTLSPRAAELMQYMHESEDEFDVKSLVAPISGKIVNVNVKVGDRVKSGSNLITIEAMKMENAIIAESDVEISEILVVSGDNVQAEQVIVKFV